MRVKRLTRCALLTAIALTIFVVGCYGIYIAGRVLLASRKTR